MGNLTVECTILTIICDMPERAKGDTWLGLLRTMIGISGKEG